MKKQSHQPHPERFEFYTETKDGLGFSIKGSNYIYKFDSQGGWKDQYGNYYNADGQPEPQPQGAISPEQMSETDQFEQQDQYERMFGPSKVIDDYQNDHPPNFNYHHIKNLQKIAINLSILQTYPTNTPIRTYFSGMNFRMSEKQIYNEFSKRVSGIINVILEYDDNKKRNGRGHFIINDIVSAQQIVKLQGQTFWERFVNFEVQNIEDFLMDPITWQQLTSFQSIKFTQQQKKQEQNKKFKIEQKVQQVHQQWQTYTFQLTYFPKKQFFKEWMKNFGLKQQIHYKNLKGITKISDKTKYAMIQLKKSSYSKCNEKQYDKKKVVFIKK